jgi:hypothetical protein
MMFTPVSDSINETIARARQCLTNENSEGYEALDSLFRRLEAVAREVFQDKLRSDYQGLVEKLEKGRVLTADEQNTLELLIIGVARTYLQMETDFPTWQTKVDRLARELEALEASGVDSTDALLRVQCICLEAKTVLPELTNYLRERERVERFENSMRSSLGAESGQLLADVVREMMQSGRS